MNAPSAGWFDTTDTGYGSEHYSRLIGTHTNKRCWADRDRFEAGRLASWRQGLASFERTLEVLPSIEPMPFLLPWHPVARVRSNDDSTGSHITEFAPGDRILAVDIGGWPQVGRVRRVQTVGASWNYAIVHYDIQRPEDEAAALRRSITASIEATRPEATPARRRKIVDRVLGRAQVRNADCYRITDDWNPVAWNRSLHGRDGDEWTLDIIQAEAFILTRIQHLTDLIAAA